MMFSEIVLTHDCISFKLLSQLEPHYLHRDVQGKGEAIRHMYRNRDYFGDGSGSRYVEAAYDTNDMMLIF